MITTREGVKADIPRIFELVKELAEFEKAPHEVTNSVSAMLQDGFGEHPAYGFIVAEEDGKIIGTSIYYIRYSTWKGRRLYLEDIIVTEAHRGKGAGKALFDETIAVGKSLKCTGMMWQVLDWNKPAITFYQKYGASFDGEWINCQLNF